MRLNTNLLVSVKGKDFIHHSAGAGVRVMGEGDDDYC